MRVMFVVWRVEKCFLVMSILSIVVMMGESSVSSLGVIIGSCWILWN